MNEQSTAAWQQTAEGGVETRFHGRQAVIARAARDCFERKGVTKTSIADITREIDITRELFYYYFDNKAAVIGAVIGSYKEDLHRLLVQAVGRGAGLVEVLVNSFVTYRNWLLSESRGTVSMGEILREAGAWEQTALDVALDTMAILRETGVTEVDIALQERFAGCVSGLVGVMNLLSTNFDVSDELLAQGLAPLF